MLTLKPLNLQVRKGGKAERAPSQDSQPLNLIDQFKLSKFASWEGGQSGARPRSSVASFAS